MRKSSSVLTAEQSAVWETGMNGRIMYSPTSSHTSAHFKIAKSHYDFSKLEALGSSMRWRHIGGGGHACFAVQETIFEVLMLFKDILRQAIREA
ncbi:hypothetical protein CGCFRS4_v009781 [Colletotrichum fructicola]|nr:hypothetical protein CGCFRS4_v009781 [Colletotrichum fructicola]